MKAFHGYHTPYIYKPFATIKGWLYKIKYAYQRMVRGYDDTDNWDIGYYLSGKLPFMLEKVKEHKGVPSLIFEEKDFDDKGNILPGIYEIRKKEYTRILEKIALGFRSYRFIQDNYPDDIESKKYWDDFNEGMALFVKYYSTLWW